MDSSSKIATAIRMHSSIKHSLAAKVHGSSKVAITVTTGPCTTTARHHGQPNAWQ